MSEMSRSARMWSLIGSNWPDRDARRTTCTRRRWRRSTGSRGSRRRSSGRARRGPAAAGTACPGRRSGSRRSSAVWVRSARFCLPQSTPSREPRVAGQRELASSSPSSLAGARSSPRARAAGSPQRGGELGARGGHALVGAGHGDPERRRAVGGQRHRVAQLAAGALAERARRRRRCGIAVGAPAQSVLGCGPQWPGAGLAGCRLAVGADERGVVVPASPGRRALVAEEERAAVVAAGVGQVGPRRWADVVKPHG